ncbi:MAG TPA: TonB-dependent receptor [Candidatus Acidoferrales bacterium]|nr:TonB-dependent receptor [Candidatus Acidoferrales bacterium]
MSSNFLPNLCRVFLALVCAALVVPILAGQTTTRISSGKGSISGQVRDAGGAILQGAQVTVDPGGAKASSDAQGQFLITGLNPGAYTVTVSYVGFTNAVKAVTVAEGQVANADASLAVASQNLQVLVTAERASGEAEELNRQRSADNVLQVLTSDVIRSLPNANMADALGRLPSVTLERDEGEGKYVQVRGTEPRLTNVTIDGVNVPSPESGVRQIKLDAIPADIVESVEINKTLQANQDPDGIGGSVNLVTKTAGERPTIALSGMGGYTPIVNGRGLVETTGTIGQRFGASKKIGALIGFSYDWNGRGIDDVEPVPDLATGLPGSPRWFDAMDVREYRYYRTRWGLAGSTDYKLGDGSNIYLRAFYSDFKNFGDRWVYSINDNTDPGTAGLLNGNGGGPSFNTQIRLPDYGIGNVVLGGRHVLSTTWYTWDVSASRSRQLGENDPTASFDSNLSSSQCTFDPAATNNSLRPQWSPVCFSEAYDPSTMSLSRISGAATGLTAQLNLQATGSMAKQYHLGSHLSTLEFGAKFRNEHKFDNSFTPSFRVPSGMTILPLSQFKSVLSNSDYYGGTYQLGPNPGYRDVLAAFNAIMPGALSSPPVVNGNNFDLIERVSAGYLMDTIDFRKVRINAGVRFEGTSLDTLTFDSSANPAPSTLTIKANGSYLKILPSASARIALAPNTDLRLIYGRGLSRPDPQDIAQAVSFSAGGGVNTASLGNPNLKAETADNFDVLVEHYLNPFGEIQVGYFYKRLTDPIVTTTRTVDNFQPTPAAPQGTYRVTQPINAGSAWVSGFEAAYIQHLSFMPGILRGLGFSANYGYTASQAKGIPGRLDNPRLLRSAPNTWNISPTYDRGRLSVRAGLSYNQANIFSYVFTDGSDPNNPTPTPGGIKGPDSDIYLYTHLQVDAQGSLRLAHGFSFVMYGLNLNNEVFGFYNGSPQYVLQREFYRPTVAAGFRWSPTREHE